MRIDTQQHRETPEGVTLTFPTAGPPIRLMAWMIDTLLISMINIVLAIVLGVLGGIGTGLYLIAVFFLTWFYSVFFEVWKDGSTPGKKRMGLQVVNDDGTPVDLVASVIRNLLRTADFLPAAFAAGLVTMTLDRDFRRLGDLAAGTLVIHRPKSGGLGRVPEEVPVAPPVVLSSEERRVLVDYASRLPRWNYERAQELANIVHPLTGERGDAGVRRLVGIANRTLGRRARAPETARSPETVPPGTAAPGLEAPAQAPAGPIAGSPPPPTTHGSHSP